MQDSCLLSPEGALVVFAEQHDVFAKRAAAHWPVKWGEKLRAIWAAVVSSVEGACTMANQTERALMCGRLALAQKR
jgi:hypothetical protein